MLDSRIYPIMKTANNLTIGAANLILKLRKERGWSQQDLAERVGVTQAAISNYEQGQNLTLDVGFAIASAFGVTAEEIWPQPPPIVVRGEMESGRVWVDGKEIRPARSSSVLKQRASDRFKWGTPDARRAELALAILLALVGDPDIAISWCHDFKAAFVNKLPAADFESTIPPVWTARIASRTAAVA